MIYTITFNPAIDLVTQVDDLKLGNLNRARSEAFVIGGKGINISVLLKRLGINSIATGFIGGFTGNYIQQQLTDMGIGNEFIKVEGITRINSKIHSNEETEINGNGPTISSTSIQQFMKYFKDNLKMNDVVFLAGNTAPGMNAVNYQDIAQLCLERKAKLVLDSNLSLLTACLEMHPFIIKPNHHELGEIFEVEISTPEEIIYYGKKLQELGARNVLVSRGGDGAILITEDQQVYQSNVPKGKVINSVGAGDSMLAGFMAEYLESQDYIESLKRGAASGSATAFSVGIAENELIDHLMQEIIVSRIQ